MTEGLFSDEVKTRSLGCTLIPYDWCPYKKRKFGCRHGQRRGDGKAQQGEDTLSSQGERPGTHPSFQPSERTNPADALIVDLQPPEL